MAMDNDMHEVEKDIQAEVLNLDGPFLTLEEFLVAERIKEKLQGASMSEQNAAPGPTADGIRRKRKKKMSPLKDAMASSVPLDVVVSAKEDAAGMFALTHVGNFDGAMDRTTAAESPTLSERGGQDPATYGTGAGSPNTITPFPSRPPTRGSLLASEPERPETALSYTTGHSAATTAYARDVPVRRGHTSGLPARSAEAATQCAERAPEGREAEAVLRRYHFALTRLGEGGALEPALLAPGGARRRGGAAAAVRAPPHARGAPGGAQEPRQRAPRADAGGPPSHRGAAQGSAGGVRAGRRAARGTGVGEAPTRLHGGAGVPRGEMAQPPGPGGRLAPLARRGSGAEDGRALGFGAGVGAEAGVGAGVRVAAQAEPDVEMLFYEVQLTRGDARAPPADYANDHRSPPPLARTFHAPPRAPLPRVRGV